MSKIVLISWLLDGENAKFIVDKAIELGMNENSVFVCSSNDEVVEKLRGLAQSGDCILVKASQGMNFKEIVIKFAR